MSCCKRLERRLLYDLQPHSHVVVGCRTALVVNASQPGARGAEVLAAASAALAATSAALRADKALFESSAMVRSLHDTGECIAPTSPCDNIP